MTKGAGGGIMLFLLCLVAGVVWKDLLQKQVPGNSSRNQRRRKNPNFHVQILGTPQRDQFQTESLILRTFEFWKNIFFTINDRLSKRLMNHYGALSSIEFDPSGRKRHVPRPVSAVRLSLVKHFKQQLCQHNSVKKSLQASN